MGLEQMDNLDACADGTAYELARNDHAKEYGSETEDNAR